MTSVTSCRRAALKSRASVIGSALDVEAVRARSSSRRRSPSHVPPGSRVRWTSRPAPWRCVGKSLGLCRLAGPIRAFDGDEPAAADRCPGTSHRPSVADSGAPPGPAADRSFGGSSVRVAGAYPRHDGTSTRPPAAHPNPGPRRACGVDRGRPGAGHRPGPSTRQLHDQPLRGRAHRARPDPARRRHRSGRDPDLPGAPRSRHRLERPGLR